MFSLKFNSKHDSTTRLFFIKSTHEYSLSVLLTQYNKKLSIYGQKLTKSQIDKAYMICRGNGPLRVRVLKTLEVEGLIEIRTWI